MVRTRGVAQAADSLLDIFESAVPANSYLMRPLSFRVKIRAKPSTFYSLRISIYYIDMHMVHKREKCTPLCYYISRFVNVGAELNVYGINTK